MKRCFFIGHRESCDAILPTLIRMIENHIVTYGVTEFIVGTHGGFDRTALAALIHVKKRYSTIRVCLLTPYHPAAHPISVPSSVDDILYPPNMETIPPRYAIIHANRYIIDHSDYLIAHLQYTPSNTAAFVRYAEKNPRLTITFVNTANTV